MTLSVQKGDMTSSILFVDFDGVLHALGEAVLDEHFRLLPNPNLFCWLHFLEDALGPYPEVGIVVSSDWRRLCDDDNLARLLGNVGHRLIGVVESYNVSRAEEIRAEVARRGITNWLAIDDHPTVVAASRRNQRFIACDPTLGLSCPHVRSELQVKLEQLHHGGKVFRSR